MQVAGDSTPPLPRIYYGGQAVIEGVMIRGHRFSCVAARRPNGEITSIVSPLSSLYTGAIRRIPMIRGIIVLIETLVLGTKALLYSTNVSLEQEGQELGKWSTGLMLTISLGFSVGLFFMLPLLVTVFLDQYIKSDFLTNMTEGITRLAIFLAYIWCIGLLPDIKRVFGYHGAEHMTVKAYESDDPLEIPQIRQYSTAHPRCGTAFLLVVMIAAILVFATLGRPNIIWLILSRILLIPIIAGVAYEVIRFSGQHQSNPLVKLITSPSLMLQKLTTREPDDDQIRVAIHAMTTVLAADHDLTSPKEEGDKHA